LAIINVVGRHAGLLWTPRMQDSFHIDLAGREAVTFLLFFFSFLFYLRRGAKRSMCKQAGSLRQATSRNKLRLGTVSVGWEKEQMEKTERGSRGSFPARF